MMALVNVPVPPPPLLRSSVHCNSDNNITLQKQQSAANTYKNNIKPLIDLFKTLNLPFGNLGNVLETMGKEGKLFPQLKDDNFDIVEKRQLSLESVEYLNYIQHDKLFQCRLCYTHAEWYWCTFHRNHVYRRSEEISTTNLEFVKFLNTDMAVVMFIEKYYYYLSSCNFKQDAKTILKTLTNFETLTDLMKSYNFEDEFADNTAYELMDFD
ncbi:hypothetical protein [Lonomia obliqua multiple nucleopolyhedrovirus]|uniref:Ac34 n=1 Tax=Lonomia obliqua multiple nucleopolyhedrovirus TaxID=134394 RepID=A0A126FC77_9ABAC|nr:hypothetical protein [Lonomia obliqua multiple nucleopolyhedrovirus]AKN81002.1 hypothetical protein [Lonomia obliqua multiple nucleopolyhedrovirus]